MKWSDCQWCHSKNLFVNLNINDSRHCSAPSVWLWALETPGAWCWENGTWCMFRMFQVHVKCLSQKTLTASHQVVPVPTQIYWFVAIQHQCKWLPKGSPKKERVHLCPRLRHIFFTIYDWAHESGGSQLWRTGSSTDLSWSYLDDCHRPRPQPLCWRCSS